MGTKYYHICPLCDDSCDCENADMDGQHCDHCSIEQTIEDHQRQENRYLNRQNARDINRKIS
jgi:hypothetical protein